MKTEILRVGGGPTTIQVFAEQHGLTMEVRERERGLFDIGLPHLRWPDHRYMAQFKGAEQSDGAFLRSLFGNGPAPEDAIRDYARLIAGKRLKVNGGPAITVPNDLTYEEPR